ncbi:hypothetical protein GCM10009647_031390 [Streptomyces sanglieri]
MALSRRHKHSLASRHVLHLPPARAAPSQKGGAGRRLGARAGHRAGHRRQLGLHRTSETDAKVAVADSAYAKEKKLGAIARRTPRLATIRKGKVTITENAAA